MKNNDQIDAAISEIADAVREPVQLKQWPTMQMVQPDGSVRTEPVPRWRVKRESLFPDYPNIPDEFRHRKRDYFKPSRIRQVLRWLGL